MRATTWFCRSPRKKRKLLLPVAILWIFKPVTFSFSFKNVHFQHFKLSANFQTLESSSSCGQFCKNTSISTHIDTTIDRVASLHVLHSVGDARGSIVKLSLAATLGLQFLFGHGAQVQPPHKTSPAPGFGVNDRTLRAACTHPFSPAPRTRDFSLSQFFTLTLWQIAQTAFTPLWHSQRVSVAHPRSHVYLPPSR